VSPLTTILSAASRKREDGARPSRGDDARRCEEKRITGLQPDQHTSEDHEVLVKKFGVSADQLKAAVKKAGNLVVRGSRSVPRFLEELRARVTIDLEATWSTPSLREFSP
jgi:hypothetical protein